MKLEDATRYTAKCFNGEPASCSYACPFHLDIRSFLEKMSKGRWVAAYKMLRDAVVFPTAVSVLCDEPCRKHCQRNLLGDEALAMLDLEAACIKFAQNTKPEVFAIPPKSKRVAVIGAGVAGLSCALNLAQKKYPVTVFEKESGWGGHLPSGERLSSHPRFADIDRDFALQFSAVDVEFRYGVEIKALEELS
ncbi:MAG: FAD-dependent oxidoreductase, partial [Peptococcaceae bacterium]|nr:FAD-dependent oxidoreductase [Peptococcaceae bacterium]